MEPVAAWQEIVVQGPLFAFMAIVIWAGATYIRNTLKTADEREAAREVRYNTLVDKSLETAAMQTKAVTEALVGNTEILRRVERKLDENRGQ